jgi:hypothetical protein
LFTILYPKNNKSNNKSNNINNMNNNKNNTHNGHQQYKKTRFYCCARKFSFLAIVDFFGGGVQIFSNNIYNI